jgi:hypothetical protein
MKRFLKIFQIIAFIMTLAIGCKKKPFDYRNNFIGNYDFTVKQYTWVMSTSYWDTIYDYHGKIIYGSGDNSVQIIFSENYSIEPTIYEDGTLEHYGEFETKDKIKFDLHWGGLGGSSGYIVTGTKIK